MKLIHKQLIVATIMFMLTFSVMLYFDAEITHLFKNHDVNTTEGNVITVNGDGSSGTGDVTNTQIVRTEGGTTYVSGSGDTSDAVAATDYGSKISNQDQSSQT